MKTFFSVLLMLLALAPGGKLPEIPDEPGIMLVDCYRAERGTEEEGGYHEFVLSTGEDGSALTLDEYRSDGGGDGESRAAYAVPEEAALRCYEFIEKAGFRSWKLRNDLVGADGVMLVCRFYDNGSYIRVSSEEMPENGQKDLEDIWDILKAYACAEYLISGDESPEIQEQNGGK
ncbi:MAG: hypothetical protein IKM02_00285 [Clostridia bacterium]|nr:hypothetical protein [Clostridia bacterium]